MYKDTSIDFIIMSTKIGSKQQVIFNQKVKSTCWAKNKANRLSMYGLNSLVFDLT